MIQTEGVSDRYDAVVIGTGAGGGSAGYKLAASGKRVLFVERGPLFNDSAAFQDEQAMQIDKRAADDRTIDFGGVRERTFTGGVVGGGTALFGACLLRPSFSDFSPGRHYGRFLDRTAWEWPVAYDEMAPFFTEAEALFGVAGVAGQIMPHIEQRPADYTAAPLPLHPTNRMLQDRFRRAGLHPFVLPMGIDPERCAHCPTCPGYICPDGARTSTLNRCIQPAVSRHGADLTAGTEVVGVHRRGRCITGLNLARNGRVHHIAADLFILAAGAIGSPVFLMQHGLTGDNDHIGRHFMFHLGVIFSALCARPTGSGRTFIKQLGLTDFYFNRGPAAHKLGYIQQLPIPGVLTMGSQLPVDLPRPLLQAALERNITFAGAIEDLPQAANRISLNGDGIRIRHRYHPYDLYRARLLKRAFLPAMRRIPASVAFAMIAKAEKLHTAHQVGTCRFGHDPRLSVLDKDCRLHHMDNLFIADGSFMPTSLGVAPALTIMANALRVAARLR